MKLSFTLSLVLVLFIAIIQLVNGFGVPIRPVHKDSINLNARHQALVKRGKSWACKPRAASLLSSSSTRPTVALAAQFETTTTAAQVNNNNPTPPAPKPTSSTPPKQPDPPANNNNGGSGVSGNGASAAEPNGAEWWLNRGLDTPSGWNPPMLLLSQVKTANINDAVKGVFAPCRPFVQFFQDASAKYGVPAMLIASIAMQESSCQAGVTGGNGEQGLMQITPEKCTGAPGGNCKDPKFNIDTGARYLKGRIDAAGGNVLIGTGGYNGWERGMTIAYATRMRWTHCLAQNNLDYLTQLYNCWVMGKDGHSCGTYRNLDACYK